MTVRLLHPRDLEPVIDIDARIVGRRRDEYFKVKLEMAANETGIEVSLAGEVDGIFAGFLIARVFYGEFGRMEPVAALEVMGVHPDFRGRGIGPALVRQLGTNLLGLGVNRVSTNVGWEDQSMISFFHREGFVPAPRFCLDLDLVEARRREETAN